MLANVIYPSSLPITQAIDEIKKLILEKQILIICGETGSGKTTQLPKILYEMGYASNQKIIGHTQPRRVAAKTIARRVAEELSQHDIHNVVGYKVRFHDKTNPNTCIKLMTDGILLQEIQNDPYLNKYGALIIDEAHERSLNIDFILGYLKTILKERPSLKLIITSATMDNTKLSIFFDNAPIINIIGKTYPVDIIYSPIDANENFGFGTESNLNLAIHKAIEFCFTVDVGNVLVFLPGEREIKECITFLHKTNLHSCQLLALYSRQNEIEQNLIFKNDGLLKIIVTTNVAETSITIPGIKFVIDSGLARIKRYNARYKIEQLQIENIAKANSQQRAGRAGRLSQGICIRLFSEDEFNLRKDYPDPEILRSNLANVLVKLMSLGLGDPLNFPFLDRPDQVSFNDGFKTLYQLKAVDKNYHLTKMGYKLAKIPVDISLSCVLINATKNANGSNCLAEVLVIVAFLSINDPRETPIQYQQLATAKHSIWNNKTSDFMAILNLWRWYTKELKNYKSNKKFLEVCRANFVSYSKLREWEKLYMQLKEYMCNLGYLISELKEQELSTLESNTIHQALLLAMLNNIGKKDLLDNFYNGSNGKKFYLHPSSGIDKNNKNSWICSANLTQTSRIYARINAIIDPEWLVPITKHLVKYNFEAASWDKKRGEVVAVQSTLLYGLIIDKRKVSYSNIDTNIAREIFIRDGIVSNQINEYYAKKYNFLKHNSKVIVKLCNLENKLRITNFIIDEELFNFYYKIIPLDICEIRSFDKWYHQLSEEATNSLQLDFNDLVKKYTNNYNSNKLYPDFLVINNTKINLKYIFDITKFNDGVTALIYLNQINIINNEPFTWLVYGLIRDKLSHVIKLLPKSIRIKLNPIGNFVTKFLEQISLEQTYTEDTNFKKNINHELSSFSIVLSNYLQQNYSISIKASDIEFIEQNSLPPHLKFHFNVLDKGVIIAEGDNLSIIKKELSNHLKNMVINVGSQYEILNLKSWIPQLANLLHEVELSDNHANINGYFSLVYESGDQEKRINFIVCDSLDKAIINTKTGFYHLVRSQMTEQIRYLMQKKWTDFKNTALYFVDVYKSEDLLIDGIDFILNNSIDLTKFIANLQFPDTMADFDLFVRSCKSSLGTNTSFLSKILYEISFLYHKIQFRLNDKKYKNGLHDKIFLQLDDLIFPAFLRYVRLNFLSSYPRYLKAILIRLDKYDVKPDKDSKIDDEIESLYETWYNCVDSMERNHQLVSKELYDFKYKIEELRVSLFAPQLKTPFVVSSKRLLNELKELTVI